MSILSEFFAEIDSDFIDSLRAEAFDQYGLDLSGVYCLHTGKQIGRFDDSELIHTIEEIGVDTDRESIIDDLIVRVIASMRPSPSLNKPNRATIQQMVATRPLDAFCYLANRLASNRYLATHRVELLEPYIQKIAIHRQWQSLADLGVDLTPWIHWLLVLDANQNLHDLTPPTHNGAYLLQMVDWSNHAEMLKLFESWVDAQTAQYERRDKEMIAQAHWARGNTMSRDAASQSWRENPQFMKVKKTPAKVGRKAESKKTKKVNSEVDEFMDLLADVFSGKIKATVSKPTTRVKTAGSFNFNFAKKGA